MTYDTCVPNRRGAKVFDLPQHRSIEVIHLPHTILRHRSIHLSSLYSIPKCTSKNLIDN